MTTPSPPPTAAHEPWIIEQIFPDQSIFQIQGRGNQGYRLRRIVNDQSSGNQIAYWQHVGTPQHYRVAEREISAYQQNWLNRLAANGYSLVQALPPSRNPETRVQLILEADGQPRQIERVSLTPENSAQIMRQRGAAGWELRRWCPPAEGKADAAYFERPLVRGADGFPTQSLDPQGQTEVHHLLKHSPGDQLFHDLNAAGDKGYRLAELRPGSNGMLELVFVRSNVIGPRPRYRYEPTGPLSDPVQARHVLSRHRGQHVEFLGEGPGSPVAVVRHMAAPIDPAEEARRRALLADQRPSYRPGDRADWARRQRRRTPRFGTRPVGVDRVAPQPDAALIGTWRGHSHRPGRRRAQLLRGAPGGFGVRPHGIDRIPRHPDLRLIGRWRGVRSHRPGAIAAYRAGLAAAAPPFGVRPHGIDRVAPAPDLTRIGAWRGASARRGQHRAQLVAAIPPWDRDPLDDRVPANPDPALRNQHRTRASRIEDNRREYAAAAPPFVRPVGV